MGEIIGFFVELLSGIFVDEKDSQPRRKSGFWTWFLASLIVIGGIVFLIWSLRDYLFT